MRRWQASKNRQPIRLDLIVSTKNDGEVEIFNWEDESQGVLQ